MRVAAVTTTMMERATRRILLFRPQAPILQSLKSIMWLRVLQAQTVLKLYQSVAHLTVNSSQSHSRIWDQKSRKFWCQTNRLRMVSPFVYPWLARRDRDRHLRISSSPLTT